MSIANIMSQQPICCRLSDTLATAASLMLKNDIGFVPVIGDDGRIIGVITDRDIVCRGIAEGQDPQSTQVAVCMSHPAVTLHEEDDIMHCVEAMKSNQLKRMLVVDRQGACRGVVSQADIAFGAPTVTVGEVTQSITYPADLSPRRGSMV